MIGVYQFTDALTASLFGMFALWAAGSRRHWFVRTAVVGAALLILLLIPAYEALIKFGVQILVVVVGLSAWRKLRLRARPTQSPEVTTHKSFWPRLSLETLLLITAVVAVVTAVAARAPHFPIYEWYECVFVGAAAGVVVLLSVWVVFGRLRWWLRLLSLPLAVFLMAIAMYWLWISRWLLQHWLTTPSFVVQYWQGVVNSGIFSGSGFYFGSITLGISILSVWLFLMRVAGWFDPFHPALADQQREPTFGWRMAARVTSIAIFALVSLFPLWLLYRLLTPTPIPDLAGPRPNGFDDLIAAGRMVDELDGNTAAPLWKLSEQQLRGTVSKYAPAYALVDAALERECRFPLFIPGRPQTPQTSRDGLDGLDKALWARQVLFAKSNATSNRLYADLALLKVELMESRAIGIDQYQSIARFSNEFGLINDIWNVTTALDAEQCLRLTRELSTLDSQRVSWATRLEHERIIQENSGWEQHLNSILNDLSGEERYKSEHYLHRKNQTRMRMLIAALAVRAFELRNGRLPTTLEELTPDYLATVPVDPFNESQPLQYRALDRKFVLFSVGPNKVDDSEAAASGQQPQANDDLTDAKEFPPPTNTGSPNSNNGGVTDEAGK